VRYLIQYTTKNASTSNTTLRFNKYRNTKKN